MQQLAYNLDDAEHEIEGKRAIWQTLPGLGEGASLSPTKSRRSRFLTLHRRMQRAAARQLLAAVGVDDLAQREHLLGLLRQALGVEGVGGPRGPGRAGGQGAGHARCRALTALSPWMRSG